MIVLTGTNGLFTRIGTIGKVLSDTNVFQGTTLVTDTDAIYAQFLANIQAEQIIDGIGPALNSGQEACEGYLSYLQTLAASIITTMVADDNPLLYSDTTLLVALQELIRQMIV